MRLISLEFEDPAAGWKLCEFEFFNDITLLVGLSGVGKTRILDTLGRLKAVAQGKTSQQLFGVQWSLVFEHDNLKYEWKGKMSEDPLGQERGVQLPFLRDDDDDEDSNRPEFLAESLIRNDSLIAQRDHEEIYFSGNKTPKLSRRESVVSLFKNEDLLKPAYATRHFYNCSTSLSTSMGLRLNELVFFSRGKADRKEGLSSLATAFSTEPTKSRFPWGNRCQLLLHL